MAAFVLRAKVSININYLPDIEKAYKRKGGLFESANKGQKWLNNSDLNVIKTPKVTITDKEVKDAYNEYTSSIRKKG